MVWSVIPPRFTGSSKVLFWQPTTPFPSLVSRYPASFVEVVLIRGGEQFKKNEAALDSWCVCAK